MSAKHTALKEVAARLFAQHGYKKTTVDDIVREAHVSKGLYYHYYPDKRTLYLSLYDDFLNAAKKEVIEKIDTSDTDFFSRYAQINRLKITMLKNKPYALDFLLSAYYETDEDIASAIAQKNKLLAKENHDAAFKGVDLSIFPDEETMRRVTETIIWISEGFVKKLNERPSSPTEEDYLEFTEYLKLLSAAVKVMKTP